MADDPASTSVPEPGSAPRHKRISKRARRGGASARLSRVLLRGSLVLALLVGTAYLAYRVLKPLRARHLARQAMQAFQRRDIGQGRASLNSALKLAPNDPTVLRITAQLLTAAGSAEGLTYWQRLFALQASPEADHRAYLELALTFDRATLAWPELTNLVRVHPQDLALLHRGVRLFLATESMDAAETWARRAWEIAPLEATNQVILGQVLLMFPLPTKQAEGPRLLLPLALGHGPEQVPAARLLARSAQLNRGERTQIARALRERVPTDPLLVAQLDLPDEPAARTAALDAMVRQFGDDDGLRTSLADWFLDRHAAAQALAVLPGDRTLTNAAWLPRRLEALARNRSWAELSNTLVSPKFPKSEMLTGVFTGWWQAGTGQGREAEGSFLEALRSATNAPGLDDPLRFVAVRAELVELPAIAVTAWMQRMRQPRLAITSGREAVRLLMDLDDEPRLREVLQQLRDLLPDDPSVAGEFACVSVMQNSEVAGALARLREVCRQRPENTSYRLALALAELRLGNPAGALALAEEAPVDWAALLPRDRVAYIAVLAANQQRATARQFAGKLDPTKLKTAERALLQEALAQ